MFSNKKRKRLQALKELKDMPTSAKKNHLERKKDTSRMKVSFSLTMTIQNVSSLESLHG